MARRRKDGSRPEAGQPEWPVTASPTVQPGAGLYFWRVYSDGREELGGYHNFRHPWQAGRFLLEVLEGAEEIEHSPIDQDAPEEHQREGSWLEYLIVTERDHDGSAAKGRRFKAKLMGVTFEEAIRLGKLHTDIRLPFSEDIWRRAAQGRPPRSYDAWESGNDEGTDPIYRKPTRAVPDPAASRSKPEPSERRPSKAERRAAAPRASRDGLRALTAICAEQKVEAGDVRAALRGMKIEKPDTGWAWPPDQVPAYVAKAIQVAKEKRK